MLHHLALGARDVAALAAFYRDWFALPEVARHHDAPAADATGGSGALRSIWLDLGGAILMIERTTEPARRVEGVGAGPFLLAFAIAPDERAAFEARLAAGGVAVEARTGHTSYFRDPEGNRCAVSHHPIAAT